MSDPAVFAPHLKPGEQIVWSGAESRDRIRAAQQSARLVRLAWAVIATGLALFIGYRFYEAMLDYARQPSMSTGIAAPLYFLFALTFAAVAVFSFLRLRRPPPEPEHYAITGQRLLALDAQGKLAGQMPAHDIGAVSTNGQHLIVAARHANSDTFVLANLDDPAAVKAAIEQTFPETTP